MIEIGTTVHKDENGKIIYSPSDLMKFMESSFITWMDRYCLELKPTEDPLLKVLQRKGIEHESNYLNTLKLQGKNVIEIFQGDKEFESAINSYEATKKAISEGTEIVYQAYLSSDNKDGSKFAGYADFLFKVDGDSKLGSYHYEPRDTKLALTTKPYFLIQLCAYAEMLETIQGVLPKCVHVVLGNGEIKSFSTDAYFSYYKRLKNTFLQQQANFNPYVAPELMGFENYGGWADYVEKKLEKEDHVSLVADIRKKQIKELKKSGITTLTQLAESTLTNVPNIPLNTFLTLKKQALLQLQSRRDEKIAYEIKNPSKGGLALLPPASINDVWFDIEGYPLVNGGLEYLFGVVEVDLIHKDGLAYKDWWAHDTQQEEQALQEFVTWVYDRWQNDPTMHIYHYGNYEVTALKRLMGRYGKCEEQIDNLLRSHVFIDLYKVVRNSLLVGEPGYSLKNVEHLYPFERLTPIIKATDSVVDYDRWLELKDGIDQQSSEILKGIRSYNEDDCKSTKYLCDWLRKLQAKESIAYSVNTEDSKEADLDDGETDKKKEIPKKQAADLAQKLLASLEISKDLDNEQKTLMQLMAYLLEFHKREEKPMSWMYYERRDMTEEELIEDIDCLGGLERINNYEYRFDAAQDTTLENNNRCYCVDGVSPDRMEVTLEVLDLEKGLARLKVSEEQQLLLPNRFSLIPVGEFVPRAGTILESIYETVQEWSNTGTLSRALEDFLRRSPRISNMHPKDIVDVISKMDNTVLCIQGPPGCGKTSKAAHAIIELIRCGKVVGITSNSHKAIDHLIYKVMETTKKSKASFDAVKIQPKSKQFHLLESVGVKQKKEIKEIFTSPAKSNNKPNDFKLIGGTAWAFSNEVAKDKLDYLFVDEAGQVPIANLFGMARSTKNIVLLGDQMQLSQPIKGSHPGESGKSCLEYFLQEHKTIPKNLGVFLDKTFRLHPDICKFISSAIYEGCLEPDDSTANRKIVLSWQDNNLITKDSGILFIPVVHENKTQSSDEEVAMIEKLISILLRSEFKGSNEQKGRPISLGDILIVAPYNKQVRKIEKVIQGARVGSVDKFQGQEAPIVIVSMCTSNGNDAPRGLEFILSKNRLNVAISRAQVLAIVVGNPGLADTSCKTVEQMELVNLFSRILDLSNG